MSQGHVHEQDFVSPHQIVRLYLTKAGFHFVTDQTKNIVGGYGGRARGSHWILDDSMRPPAALLRDITTLSVDPPEHLVDIASVHTLRWDVFCGLERAFEAETSAYESKAGPLWQSLTDETNGVHAAYHERVCALARERLDSDIDRLQQETDSLRNECIAKTDRLLESWRAEMIAIGSKPTLEALLPRFINQ